LFIVHIDLIVLAKSYMLPMRRTVRDYQASHIHRNQSLNIFSYSLQLNEGSGSVWNSRCIYTKSTTSFWHTRIHKFIPT